MPTFDEPMNVIWVFGDQHRGQALSCAGDPNVNTPNIDRLAAEGVWFRNAVMGYPLCCPARGSILTGRYPHVCVPGHEHPLPDDAVTLAEPLRDAGYHTAWFGKWHLSGQRERDGRLGLAEVPRRQRGGFDTWIGYENNNAQFDCHVHGHRDNSEVARYRLPRFETDAFTDLLLNHVEERATSDRPFFAALSVQPPHDPYTAPPEWMGRHHPARVQLRSNVPDIPCVVDKARRELPGYYALIENLDWNLGRVRATLEALGLTQRTFVVFFSDHGDQHGSHGYFLKMTPYQEAIHVPMIIGGPAHLHYKMSHVSESLFNHVDLAPTTLGLCGLDQPAAMQGFDYSGRYRDERRREDEPEATLLQSILPTGHGPEVAFPWRGILTRDGWKYVAFSSAPYLMFNLNEDPYEQRNLAHQGFAQARRRELQQVLAKELKRVGDDFPLPAM